MNTFIQIPPAIRIGGSSSKSLYQFTLQDTDLKSLYEWAPKVEARMAQVPGLQDVTSDLRIASPQITVDIDRDKARALGISASDIENTLYNAFGQRQVSTIYTASNQYYVIMEVLPQYQRDPVALSKLYVRSSSQPPAVNRPRPAECGGASSRQDVAPVSVAHFGQLPAVTISFNLAPGISIGQAVDSIDEAMRDMNVPATHDDDVPGHGAGVSGIACKIHGFCWLSRFWLSISCSACCTKASFTRSRFFPGLPSAALGALLTLMVFGSDLNIYAIRRHPAADRHREEERDHDDRLRSRGAAQRKASRRTRRSSRALYCASVRS